MAAPPSPIRVPGTAPPSPGHAIQVSAAGRPVAVFNAGGTLYALGDRCTHAGGPLHEGTVEGTTVTCPWHGSEFDLPTGAVRRGPARAAELAYRVRVDGADLVLEPVAP